MADVAKFCCLLGLQINHLAKLHSLQLSLFVGSLHSLHCAVMQRALLRDHELKDLHASIFRVLGLKVRTAMPGTRLCFNFSSQDERLAGWSLAQDHHFLNSI